MEMRAWQDLGVVETIYEDDQEEEEEDEEDGDEPEAEDERSDSPSVLSSSATSTPTHLRFPCLPPPSSLSLRRVVHAWSRANGCRTDIVIRLNDQCFHLHRDPIVKHSGYLRRLLTESSDVALILPSGLTADAFAAAVISCYGAGVALTPSTLPAVRAAAEWLDLGDGGGDLVARTEEYFFREVATDSARAAAALRSCAALLAGGAAAAAAPLLARCVEALAGCGGAGDGDGDGDDEGGVGGWLEEVAALPPEEFLSVAEAMRARCAHDHDLLYRIVDHYLENNKGKLTEEEKSRLCYSINCTKLSHSLFMHLVQNPRLPLRFVVQAMLVEQLNTHRSFFHRTTAAAAAAAAAPSSAAAIVVKAPRDNDSSSGGVATTLGAILNRDAALRQSAQLRSSMQATSFRIDGLEREIDALRQCLRSAEDGQTGHGSASFRILPDDREDGEEAECSGVVGWDRWAFGARLLRGLKNLFKKPAGSTAVAVGRSSFRGGGGGSCAGGGGVAVKEVKEEKEEEEEVERRPHKHRRNRSLV